MFYRAIYASVESMRMFRGVPPREATSSVITQSTPAQFGLGHSAAGGTPAVDQDSSSNPPNAAASDQDSSSDGVPKHSAAGGPAGGCCCPGRPREATHNIEARHVYQCDIAIATCQEAYAAEHQGDEERERRRRAHDEAAAMASLEPILQGERYRERAQPVKFLADVPIGGTPPAPPQSVPPPPPLSCPPPSPVLSSPLLPSPLLWMGVTCGVRLVACDGEDAD